MSVWQLYKQVVELAAETDLLEHTEDGELLLFVFKLHVGGHLE